MFLIILGFITFLILLGFFMYELLTPGSLFRYYLCRIGSSSGPQLGCMYNTSEEVRQHAWAMPTVKCKVRASSAGRSGEGAIKGRRACNYVCGI